MWSTFPTMMAPTVTSSTPPMPPAIGQPSPLTQQVLWDYTLQSPSIPTMMSTFPTMMSAIMTSSNATCSSGCTTASNWNDVSVDTIGDVGLYTSIAIDSNNDVHISYYDVSNKDLKYAYSCTSCITASNWYSVSVDTGGSVGLYTSIAIDSNDDVHIHYTDSTNANLKYATCSSGCTIREPLERCFS